MRIRDDYVFGTTTAALTNVATSMSSAELARLGVVANPDIAAITLHNSTTGLYEIVHVTAHTAAATTATILRGQEGSSAQAWPAGTTWLHGVTATDLALKADLDAPALTGAATLDGQAIVKTNDPRLTDARTPVAHTHTLANVTDVTASAAEVNILDGAIVTVTEINFLDGVTSSIQTQLNGKAASSHTHVIGDLPTDATVPAALGTAAAGTATTIARRDHVHAMPTAAQVGAAATSHTHTKANITDFAHTHLIADLPTDATVPAALGVAAAGTAATVARRDHVHAMPTAADVGASPSSHGHALTDAGITGVLAVAKGGTNSTATPTNGGVGYGTGTAHAYTAAGTSKQVIQSNGAAAPSWVTLDLTYMPDAWIKKAARVATTVNITLSGTQTIDTVAVVAGDRVLVKNQTTAAQNGLYTVAAGAWTRVAGGDSSVEIAGATVSVDQGSQGGQIWTNTFKTTDTLGTTAMNWYKVVDTSQVGAVNGVASLDAAGDVPIAQIPTGTTGTTVALGNHTHALSAITSVFDATVPAALGTAATGAAATAARRDHVHAMPTAANVGAEPAFAAGTAAQYRRGDKTWQTLNATAVGLGNVTNEAQALRTLGGDEAVAVASGTSGTVTLNCATASVFTLAPTAAVTTLSITNPPASGNACTITLIVNQGATPYAIATPTGGVFYGAASPTQAANKDCIFTYLTTTAGASWHCSAAVQA